MTQTPPKYDYRALLQQALVTLDQMEARLRAAEQSPREPIAIVGMGMRFPGGANDARSFWDLLRSGTDTIGEVPPDRWDAEAFYDPDPDAVGKMYTRWGGFLKDVDRFDPHFFGISPREAVSMDPQQRLLLETTWEALENAGQANSRLAGSRTGVFLGMVGSDYANLKMITGGINDVDAYFGMGVSRSIAAGRIAYTLGLHGPAVAVDTACSSSLVAAHQACQSLRLKECDMAVAGGVNLILEPSGSISTSRSRMMSFDGRCKTFDKTADGYVRSEGCAMIVLKRLSDALSDGDNILAVILGTALNQDGRSNGLTAPNGKAQEAVIRAALEDARLKPADIGYVETHGTGTSLGDPIEVRALGAVFGEGRSSAAPLMIGSVKTNVGHLEAAAGIVGLVKVVLALQNKTIPPHINLKELNPYIPWSEMPITVPTQAVDWTVPEGKRRVAGLSSFGFSGTNAHMVIAEAPPRPAVDAASIERPLHLFTLAARSQPALHAMAQRMESRLSGDDSAALADVAYSLNTGRSNFSHRLALPAATLAEARAKLAAWRGGENPAGVFSGADGDRPEVVFLFTGQGAQYPGMARELYETQPVFRKTMQQCEEILRPYLDKPLLSVIYPTNPADEALIHQTAYTQPALFAVEYSLAKLWQSWGVEPAAVIGHSIGEYPAACIAGVFSLEDGLKLVAERGRLMQALPSGGVMAAVFASEERVSAAIAPYRDRLSLAAANGPTAMVISGQADAVRAVLTDLEAEGIKSQPIQVSHAFHSPLMDSMLAQFEAAARSVQYGALRIGVVSNVTGRLVTDSSLADPAYWRAHARQTVRFAAGIRALFDEGYRFFLEIGPNPTLLGMARRCGPDHPDALWLPSLRSGRGDWEQMLESLAQLYTAGQPVDWESFEAPYKVRRRMLELPTYPFQRERYWLDFKASRPAQENPTGHPLLGSRLDTASPVFQNSLTPAQPPYLADHNILGLTLLPAAAYIETALAAARSALDGPAYSVTGVSIHEALPLSPDAERVAQLILTPGEDGAEFQYFSREPGAEAAAWRLHARGRLQPRSGGERPAPVSIAELQARITEPMAVDSYYGHLASVGAKYGPAFQGIQAIWRMDGEALGQIALPAAAGDESPYTIHPSLLDACFQMLGAAVPGAANLDSPDNILIYVPVACGQVDLYGPVRGPFYCHVRLDESQPRGVSTLTGDLALYDPAGQPLGVVTGLRLQRVDQQSLRRAVQGSVDGWFYTIDWVEQPLSAGESSTQAAVSWLVFGESPLSSELAAELQARGETCRRVAPGEAFERADEGLWRLNPRRPEDFTRLLAEIGAIDGPGLRGVVYLWGAEAALPEPLDLEAVRVYGSNAVAGALHLVQALAAGSSSAAPRLWMVTQGAQPVRAGEPVNPAAAELWGFANVVALEHPDLNITRVDLDPASADAAALLREIWSPDGEDQVALRAGKRFAARLAHAAAPARSLPTGEPVELVISERGLLENLTLRPAPRRKPGPGEVEIAVRATGLNFRDVLNALGMYPGDAGPLGSECSGIVTAVGEGVTELEPGDPVIALASRSFGSFVTLSTGLVVPKPAGLKFEDAATIPIAFLTAAYALETLAQIQPGSRVLIHAAAGGVGQAAVQLARRAGAEIFGTAGSDAKREYLKSIGVQHVLNSRTFDFADQIMEITAGEGVDIVLNSLAGDFIPKSLSVLKPGGAFVEIGKTGVWDAEQAAAIVPGLRYFVLYLGQILEQDPGLIRAMLLDLLGAFERGVLKPLPRQDFPLEQAAEAFRYMAQARHIGKIVITQSGEPSFGLSVRGDASYLITGGLGGLGLVTARWLAEKGARSLVLVGRGTPSAETRSDLDTLRAAGVTVSVARGDVADRERMAEILREIAAELPPLRGVIHAAGVLDDGVLSEQNWARFETVMAPKVAGAWNIHALTAELPLDFFVLFSAGAALLGSPGQSNYAAANAFLDGLAHYRRAQGLPALSINWGAWAEVGMAARLGSSAQRRWAAQGVDPIRPADGMRALEALLERGTVQAAVLPIHWQKFNRQAGQVIPPLLRGLLKGEQPGEAAAPARQASLRDQLNAAPPEEQYTLLFRRVTEEVNKVLGLSPNHVTNPRQGFTDIGLDSLMAVELSNHLQKELACRLPATLTFEYPTIEALTQYLASEILAIAVPETSPKPAQDGGNQQQAIMQEVESIPEDDLEDAILKELKNAGY